MVVFSRSFKTIQISLLLQLVFPATITSFGVCLTWSARRRGITLQISVFKPEWLLVSLAKQLWGHTCLVTCHAQHDPCKVTQVSCSDVYGVGSMDGDEGFDGWCCLCGTPYGFSPERRHPFNTTLKVWNDLDGSQKIKEFEAFDP